MNSIFSSETGSDPVDDSSAQFQGNEADLQPTPPSPNPAAIQPENVPDTQMVVLSGERVDEALPEGLTNIGSCPVELPDPITQASGFRLTKEAAAVLVGQFRQYKFLTVKGQTTPPVKI